MRLGEESDMNRKDGTRKYGNMGISYRKLSEASGCSQYKIMTYVRLLEPIVEETDWYLQSGYGFYHLLYSL